MRIVNVIVVRSNIVDSIDSFGIEEEQLSDAVIEDAEKLFKLKILLMCGDPDEECFNDKNPMTMDDYVEDGYYHNIDESVCLTWSDI